MYLQELKKASQYLADKPDTIFLGQNAIYGGSMIRVTFEEEVPKEKLLELPVFEHTQLGMSIGLSLNGYVPISLFPRSNFFLFSMGMLVNELDRNIDAKVIMKVMNGANKPIDPGLQHTGDFTDSIQKALKRVEVINLDKPEKIMPAYEHAYQKKGSTILVEWGDLYR